jgi:hypothetical protein
MLLLFSANVRADTLEWKTSFGEAAESVEDEQNPFETTATALLGTKRERSVLEANIPSWQTFDAVEQDGHDYFDNLRGDDVDDHWHHDPPSPVPESGSAILLVIGLAMLLDRFTKPHPHQTRTTVKPFVNRHTTFCVGRLISKGETSR